METIQSTGVARAMWRAVLSSFKRPGPVSILQPISWQTECAVEASQLNQYAEMCGFKNSSPAPLTYPQLLTTPLVMAYVCSRHCPWPAMGTVHLANAITQHQPVQAGDALQVQLHSGELWAHAKGQAYALHLRVLRQRDGACLWQAQQTLLRLGVQAPAGTPWVEGGATPLLKHRADFSAPVDIGRRYARISKDYNPIHWSALSARLLGFKWALAHGLWTQARALALLYPQDLPQSASLTTQFKRPLRLPSRASVWATTANPNAPIFEVRDALGHHVHLHAQLQFHGPDSGPMRPDFDPSSQPSSP
jgi:acyl dehydratase